MKKFIMALSLVSLVFFLIFAVGSCIPTIPEPVLITNTNCYLADPYVKPKLPRVIYVQHADGSKGFKDKEQENNAREREILLIQYANQILDLYIDAQMRCNDQSTKE